MYESTEKRIVVYIPGVKLLSTRGAGANAKGHHQTRGKVKRFHRGGANSKVAEALGRHPGCWTTLVYREKKPNQILVAAGFALPDRILFTRICPKRHFCDEGDNLTALFKSTRDGTADALGVDDKFFVPTHPDMPVQSGTIGVWYEQIDGSWGLRITIES
jgi:hypothetical protein